MELERK